MSYRRRYPKRQSARQRYQVENILSTIPVESFEDTSSTTAFTSQGIQDVVPALASNFPRKVAHITLHFDQITIDFIWALIYVPAGYVPNFLGITTDSPNLYNPNQFLMASGYVNAAGSGGQVNFRIPQKRILNSGDNIRLIVAVRTVPQELRFAARYAICAL